MCSKIDDILPQCCRCASLLTGIVGDIQKQIEPLSVDFALYRICKSEGSTVSPLTCQIFC